MIDAELIDRIYSDLRKQGMSDDEAFKAAREIEDREIAADKGGTSNEH